MLKLKDEIIHFLHKENYTVVSTIDKTGAIHNSCKGIVDIDPNGKIYLLDLYKQRTYDNLKKNPNISITVVNEHSFRGYCIKGKAELVDANKFGSDTMKAWEKKITGRISQRIIKNMQGSKGHKSHPEAMMPEPEYLIAVEAEKIVDLTPHALK